MKEILEQILAFITHRLFILVVIFIIMFYLLIMRLFQLQIVEGESHLEEFSLSVLRERELEGQRGYIYDRNGYPLAENVLAYTVLLDGSINVEDKNQMTLDLYNAITSYGDEVVKSFPIEIDTEGNFIFSGSSAVISQFRRDVFVSGTSKTLTDEQITMNAENMYIYVRDRIFDIDTDDYTDEEIINILDIRFGLWLKRFYQYKQETIAVNIKAETLAVIVENMEKFPGASIVEDPLRKYNYPEYFAHIIGYIRTIDADQLAELKDYGYNANDIVGQIGIEEEMELYLHGTDGVETVEVDILGRTMGLIDIEEPVTGNDVYLTIDKDLQVACYDILEKHLASIICDNLYIKPQEDEDDEVLLNEVFVSLFKNDIISLDKIKNSNEDEYQHDIYNIFLEEYYELTDVVEYALSVDDSTLNDEYSHYYKYLLNNLMSSNYLSSDYKDSEVYAAYLDDEASFYELLNDCLENDYLTIVVDENSKLSEYEKLSKIILEEYLNYEGFKKMIYLDLVKDEAFSLVTMCNMLVEQRIVTSTEEQLEQLKNKDLSTLEFMKEKILALEITPHELAIDPYSGSIVIEDVNNGELLALVSYPSYDNNYLVNDFDNNYYYDLLSDPTSPLYPRATMSKTAPGSTFKMVSAIAGLAEGVITTTEKITCLGKFQKIVPSAACWIYAYGSTHGPTNLAHAIEVSCNYFFYELGYRLCYDDEGNFSDNRGVSTLQKYASIFGLGRSTGIEIGDATSDISDLDAVRSAIGQSKHNYTPVQLARYIAMLANRGTLYNLSLVDKVLDTNGDVLFDKEPVIESTYEFEEDHIDTVLEGMYLSTHNNSNTSGRVFNDFEVDIAGKTGTAQESPSRPNHGLFVSYAPYDDPDISIVCVVPFGHGSSNAVYLAEDIYKAYYEINETTTSYIVNHKIDE